MNKYAGFVKVLGWIVGTMLVLSLIGFGLFEGGMSIGVPFVLFFIVAIGWLSYVYFRYRFVRQDELVQVLASAAAANMPLIPAIRAYVRDRPSEGQWGWWDVTFLFAFPPAYWLMHQRHTYDRRAADVADALEDGQSLHEALRSVRGAAPSDVAVAASVGETTGRLSECLRRSDRDRLAGVWLEIVPRLAYPLALLLFVVGIATFFMSKIMPRIQRIFDDFKQPLPDTTIYLNTAWASLSEWWLVIAGSIAAVLGLVALIIASPLVRWRLPLIGRAYRWEVQGLILRMLGALVAAGRPLPESLARLVDAADFPPVVRRRIYSARQAIERGDSLADSLYRVGLLPSSMAPLVRAAQRAHTLPWALTELGEVLSGRATRVVRRVSLILSPALVIVVGTIVGFIVLAMFLPLIQLLTRLSS
jgi:type II secretory pathway component PulF